MFFIIFNGTEMKTRTRKSLTAWFKRNRLNIVFDWKKLREEGEVASSCDQWYISKVDGREIVDIEWLERYVWIPQPGKICLNIPIKEWIHGY